MCYRGNYSFIISINYFFFFFFLLFSVFFSPRLQIKFIYRYFFFLFFFFNFLVKKIKIFCFSFPPPPLRFSLQAEFFRFSSFKHLNDNFGFVLTHENVVAIGEFPCVSWIFFLFVHQRKKLNFEEFLSYFLGSLGSCMST